MLDDSTFRFGTVGSPKTTPAKPGGSVGAVIHLAALEFSALELGWVQSVRVSESTCQLIQTTAVRCDVAVSVHAPYFINLNADDTEWPKSRRRLMDAAHFGNLAGATDIIFHPGSYFGHPAQEVLPVAIERLAGCVQELRDQGNPVILRPETMGKPAMLGSFEDCLAMSRAIPGVEPCLDFAHLHARTGDGTMNSYAEWMPVLEAYAKSLGDQSLQRLHIHLSGIAYSAAGEREHLPVQESDLEIPALFQALKAWNCGGRILCESPLLEEDALYLKTSWKAVSGKG
jgi:deoxyribonuclease-4